MSDDRIKRVLITTGGTGGHVFPAEGLAQALQRKSTFIDVRFAGGGLSSNRYFNQSSFCFHDISCGPLISKNPLKILKGCLKTTWGFYQSLNLLRKYQPHLVVGFGSYYTLPILLAAKWLNIPFILHEANSVPGKANQWLAPYAHCVGVHFPYAATFFNNRAIEVGMPLREGFNSSSVSKEEALKYFGFDSTQPVLLIFGGSQGAQAINQWMKEFNSHCQKLSLQIIHLTGHEKMTFEFEELYRNNGIKACVKGFEYQMNYAWKAADFFIGRSGASTIAEAMEFEVPGILIPYPSATDNHQEKNADFLVETVKGGIKILEKDLDSVRFKENLISLLQGRLSEMRQSIRQYKQQPNKISLPKLILNFLSQNN
jgi:UDP-N-acetylglucosamine--N-acetylmuramyl-(pentapeptide) pyrophosphoryl-undecaprenol N-acetylglucosamine transferase